MLGSDGVYHDGRTPKELEKSREFTAFIFQPIHGMRELGGMDASPEEYWRRLPDYMRKAAIEFRDRAHAWLTGFATISENYNAKEALVSGNRRSNGQAQKTDKAASA